MPKKYHKLGIGLLLTCILYGAVTFFYSSYAGLSCNKVKNTCSYYEKNLIGTEFKGISLPFQNTEMILDQHKHQYYTGRIVRRKTTTDYQLKLKAGELELPIFNQTYIWHELMNIKNQWIQFRQNKTQNILLIEQGIVGWIWYLSILIGILGLEILAFILFPHQKK